MKSGRQAFVLHIELDFGQSLLSTDTLAKLQTFLRSELPSWSSGVHVWRPWQDRVLIDLDTPGAIERAVVERGLERGDLYARLAADFGKAEARKFGSAELRGKDPSLTLLVNFDEDVFVRRGNQYGWGNVISFQILRRKVEGQEVFSWARTAFERLCSTLSPWYGHSELREEFDEKNISRMGGGMEAVGVDVSESLPGLYWLNFFGQPCRDFIGAERLLSAPAYQSQEVDEGVLIALSATPSEWSSDAYKQREHAVIAHVGSKYFFSRDDLGRAKTSPLRGVFP